MSDDCPFFTPSRTLSRDLMAVGIFSELTSVGIYCRLPTGRVRVPNADEVKRHCVPARFAECPVFRSNANGRG
jgi:hypothetical protein